MCSSWFAFASNLISSVLNQLKLPDCVSEAELNRVDCSGHV